jgi:hypothetical protein
MNIDEAAQYLGYRDAEHVEMQDLSEYSKWWELIKKLTSKDETKDETELNSHFASGSFSYEELILKLEGLGFELKIVSGNDVHVSFSLQMNGINVGSQHYPIFGRYCGGAYNTCGRSNQTVFTNVDLEKAINHCSKLLMNEIEAVSLVPNYFTCKDYLYKNFGKTKVEKLAIDRVFKIIKENYNDIIRSM